MHHGANKWSCLVLLAAMACSWVLAGPARAAEYNLRADVTIKVMPDGRQVRMWGFACESATAPAVCPNPGVVTVPGPELIVDPGDPSLIINLTNNLPEPVSIIIPGQVTAMTPVPLPGSNPLRYRSFTSEAAENGGAQTYTWADMKPGTFLYESGSHLSVQVPMGLYGAVKMNAAAGEAYAGVAYDTEVTLLFSEVDPDLNAAVAGDPVTGALPNFGSPDFPSSIMFIPRYFLLNGDSFPFGNTHTYVGPAGSSVLMRFLNAGLLMRSPVVLGGHMSVVAEDGNPYPNAKTQYSLDLAAGKTLDAIGTAAADGYFPIFDRRLGLTNADASTGGMLTYLEVGPSHVDGDQAMLNIVKTGVGTGAVESISLPGGISCGPICSQHYLPGTELRLTAIADPGSVFFGWTGCTQTVGMNDCLVTLPTDVVTTPEVTVTASFVQAVPRAGVYRSGQWFLDKDLPGWQGEPPDQSYDNFGAPSDIPVSGDMNGDGFTEVGTYRPATGQWFFDLDNSGSWSGCLGAGGTDLCLAQFGAPTDIPVTGDWNGDGIDEVGTYRQGMWFFDMDGSGTWDPNADAFRQNFGAPTDIPVTGDWNGDGTTEIGTYRQGMWFLDYNGNGRWDDPNDPSVINKDTVYQNFGAPTDIPVTADWDSDGTTEVGTYRQGVWFLDNGNGQWDAGVDQVILNFGAPTDKPVTGIWR